MTWDTMADEMRNVGLFIFSFFFFSSHMSFQRNINFNTINLVPNLKRFSELHAKAGPFSLSCVYPANTVSRLQRMHSSHSSQSAHPIPFSLPESLRLLRRVCFLALPVTQNPHHPSFRNCTCTLGTCKATRERRPQHPRSKTRTLGASYGRFPKSPDTKHPF